MKKIAAIIILSAAATLIILTPLLATSEFTVIQEPTKTQQCVLLGLEREISEVQKEIQLYYKDLLDDPCDFAEGGDPTILDCRFYRVHKNGWAVIPLTMEKQTYYGLRDRYVYSEVGYIKWSTAADKKGKIESFRFEQKRTRYGQGYSVMKTLTGRAVILEGTGVRLGDKPYSLDLDECLARKPESFTPLNIPLNMLVKESLVSGRGQIITFRFPKIGEKDQRDKTEVMDIDGKPEKVQLIWVRNYNQKIDMSREYLRLLKQMLIRIDWNTRAINQRKLLEIERILKSK